MKQGTVKILKKGTAELEAVIIAQLAQIERESHCRCTICHEKRVLMDRLKQPSVPFEADAREYITSKPTAYTAKDAFNQLFKPEGQDNA